MAHSKFIKDRFNYRSIELLPVLKNPLDGKTYRNVIRSIGFLPPDIPPAVAGQNPSLALEFAEEQDGDEYIVVFTGSAHTHIQEDTTMKIQDESQKTQDVSQEGKVVDARPLDVEEFEALKARVLEMEKRESAMREENKTLSAQLTAETQKREEQAIHMFCQDMSTRQISDKQGNRYIVAQAFVDQVKPLLSGLDNSTVVEFSAEKKQTSREAVQELCKQVVELAASGVLVMPIGLEEYAQHHSPPEEQAHPKSEKELILEFYGQDARQEAKNPEDPNEVFLIACSTASRENFARIPKGGK
jgi:hypothetical protein